MKKLLLLILLLLQIFQSKAQDLRIPIKPVDDRGGEMLYFNLKNKKIEWNETSAWRKEELQKYQCDIFVSTHNQTECLGVEINPKDLTRKVTVMPINNVVGNYIVWAWNGDGTLRPLNDLSMCLTHLGYEGKKRAFTIEKYTGAENQIWTFDARTKAIVNSKQTPVRDKTLTLDRYNEVISWSYNASWKQTWLKASTWLEGVNLDNIPLKYPVKLIGSGNQLREPVSVKNDRLKMSLNQLMASYGKLPFRRDFTNYPGLAPNKPMVTKRMRLDMKFDRQERNILDNWKSTGLYAPPYKDIVIQIHNPQKVNFKIRFNPHTDQLKTTSPNVMQEKEYKRSPIASQVIQVSGASQTLKIQTDLGGLLYIEGNQSFEEVLDISITALPALYYNGSQTASEWEQLCQNPTPWGEIEGKYFVITDRSKILKNLNKTQLDALINYYDSLVIAHDILLGFSEHLRYAKHRFVTDIQISAGYGHSGFPIMMYWDVVKPSPTQIDIWGNGHELGHNCQQEPFSSRFGGEVTVNLFTVHSFELQFPHKLDRLESAYDAVIEKFKKGTLNYDNEKDVFLQVIFLLQMKDYAGWQPYKKLYTLLRSISEEERRQKFKTAEDKLDFFYINISKFANTDFKRHFQNWKLPISAQAQNIVANMQLAQPNKEVSTIRQKLFVKSEEAVIVLTNLKNKRVIISEGACPVQEEGDLEHSTLIVDTKHNSGKRQEWLVIKNDDKTVSLQNRHTQRFLYSTGNPPTKDEGGWLESPSILGTAHEFDERSRWYVEKVGENIYKFKNKVTQRLLFSTNEEDIHKKGEVVGADKNYYDLSVWQVSGKGVNYLENMNK